MAVRNIKEHEIEKMTKVLTTKATFINTFSNWIKEGLVKLEWCFVLEEQSEFLGAVIYGNYGDAEDELEILGIKLRDNENLKKCVQTLAFESINQLKTKGIRGIGCHLYSDKEGYSDYVEGLRQAGFTITQEKKSFVWQLDKEAHYIEDQITFKSLAQVGQDAYMDAIEKVTTDTLDREDSESVLEHGSKVAAQKYFNELKDIDFNQKWWELAYNKNAELIGLVIPQKFNEDVGAINYIGVTPSQRGKGYVSSLIKRAVYRLSHNGIKEIIADIDVNNHPLDKALQKESFNLGCTMVVLKYRGVE